MYVSFFAALHHPPPALTIDTITPPHVARPLCGPNEFITKGSTTELQTCSYCPTGTYRKDAAHRKELCIEGIEDLDDAIAGAVGVDGVEIPDTTTLSDLLVENADALDAMELAADDAKDALRTLEQLATSCNAGSDREGATSCAVLVQRKTNAEAEYKSSLEMVEQLKEDKEKLETASASASASAASAVQKQKASTTTAVVVVVALTLIVAIVAAAVYVKKKGDTVLVHSDMMGTSFENPNYALGGVGDSEQQYADAGQSGGGQSGYMDVNPASHGDGAGAASGYMDVAPTGATAGGYNYDQSDEEEV